MPQEDEKLPSPDELLLAASALARHLSGAGVRFLPRANEDRVAPLAARFPSENAETIDVTVVPAADREVPGGSVSPVKPRPVSPRLSNAQGCLSNAQGCLSNAQGCLSNAQGYSLPVLSADQRVDQLAELQSLVATCSRCPQLATSRTRTVFGEGNPTARVAFFGEGPGADEDRTGRPFVGRAGQLLTKMIQACTFSRDDVYILNTVKCRPPGNRNPEPTELSNCREYFERQLEIIQPEYIVCLGAVSAQTLLQTTESVGRLRGRWHPYFASKVLVTYHPAYLLRNPAAKKAAWDDLKMMLADMGIQV